MKRYEGIQSNISHKDQTLKTKKSDYAHLHALKSALSWALFCLCPLNNKTLLIVKGGRDG
jgi:hypothetical protein